MRFVLSALRMAIDKHLFYNKGTENGPIWELSIEERQDMGNIKDDQNEREVTFLLTKHPALREPLRQLVATKEQSLSSPATPICIEP